jgi:hypothetical protein
VSYLTVLPQHLPCGTKQETPRTSDSIATWLTLIRLPNEQLQEIKKCVNIRRLFNGVLADTKPVLRRIG